MVTRTGDREIGVVSRRVGMYVYEVDQELGGGELSSSAWPEVGNRPPEKKKMANPQMYAWRGKAC